MPTDMLIETQTSFFAGPSDGDPSTIALATPQTTADDATEHDVLVGEMPAPAPLPEATVDSPRRHAPVRTGSPSERRDIVVRLARLPTFATTARGKRLCRFPVVETLDAAGGSGETWQTVLAFNALAASLERQVQAGELTVEDTLRVIAYPQTTLAPDETGTLTRQEILFAAQVTKRPSARQS